MNPQMAAQHGGVLMQKTETPTNDISQLNLRVDNLISGQATYLNQLLNDRRVRLNDPDVDSLRRDNKIGQADTVIGPKLIDQNIKMSKVPKLQYIISPARVAMFTPVKTALPPDVIYALEQSFTWGLRYPDWTAAYERADDASELHGYGVFEVMFDQSKPMRVAINYVENDFLVFDHSVRDIQDCDIVLRGYELTLARFEQWLSKQPGERQNPVAINKLREVIVGETRNSVAAQPTTIYRLYLKQDGKIKTCWYWTGGSNDERFLTIFVPFSNGIMSQEPSMSETLQITAGPQPTPQSEFPFFLLELNCTEETRIASQRGRAVFDLPLQAAAGSTITSLVNGCNDASKTMWSPKGSDDPYNFTAPKTIQMVLKANEIWSTEMSPWHSDYPDALLFRVYEGMMSQGMQQANQVNWTVNNRQDTRKTGTEIKSSERLQAQINTSSVLQESKCLRKIYEYGWKITQSQILYAGLRFWLPNLVQNIDPNLLSLAVTNEYTIAPAGEKDFLEKEVTLATMREDLPLVLKTNNPELILAFTSDYMTLRLPEYAPKYIEIMKKFMAEQQMKQRQVEMMQQQQMAQRPGGPQPQLQLPPPPAQQMPQ